MDIKLMMLQVLDDPTGVRIILETSYPDFNNYTDATIGNAYFMIDRGECDCSSNVDGVECPSKVYDYWQVSDSLGQTHKFNSNAELVEFLDTIKGITRNAWVESF